MFTPAKLLSNPHLQTVWGRLVRSRRAVKTTREVVETPDGDEVVLDHLAGPSNSPRVILLHGLEGSSNSVYIQGILQLLQRRDVAATVLNFRACARHPASVARTIPNRGRRLYHSGETSDLDFIATLLAEREPERPLFGFGASLGGNVLLKWLGERGSAAPISRAATLSVPYDLAAGSRFLEHGIGRLYTRSFLRSLNAKATAVCAAHPDLQSTIDLARGRRAKTFFEYDDAITAPLHGFAGAVDYYQRSSSIHYLERITVPTLCISAEDDPFLPPAVLAEAQSRASANVRFIVTRKGGHVGFIAGSLFRPRYWAEEKIVDFLLDSKSGS
jgi:predicted alpha/beta-fold hydrolase